MRSSGVAPTGSGASGSARLLNRSSFVEWLKCAYRYDLGVRRHIHSRGVSRAPELGSCVHAGLEAVMKLHHKQSLAFKVVSVKTDSGGVVKVRATKITRSRLSLLFNAGVTAMRRYKLEQETMRKGVSPEEQLLLDQILEDAIAILHNALPIINVDRWSTVEGKNGPLIESSFILKDADIIAAGWDGVHITPDWIVYDEETNGVMLADYKVRGQFTTEEDAETDVQAPFYIEVLRRLGLEVSGDMHIQILSSPPAQPKTNKDGSMSRAQVRTTWPLYEKALRKAGLDPADYRDDMEPKLSGVKFVYLLRSLRTIDETFALWNEVVIPTAEAMSKRKKWKTRNFGFMNCKGCWAKAFCLAELRGEDTDFLLKTQYIDSDNPSDRLLFDLTEEE